jgi:hypothetical protein
MRKLRAPASTRCSRPPRPTGSGHERARHDADEATRADPADNGPGRSVPGRLRRLPHPVCGGGDHRAGWERRPAAHSMERAVPGSSGDCSGNWPPRQHRRRHHPDARWPSPGLEAGFSGLGHRAGDPHGHQFRIARSFRIGRPYETPGTWSRNRPSAGRRYEPPACRPVRWKLWRPGASHGDFPGLLPWQPPRRSPGASRALEGRSGSFLLKCRVP